MTRLSLIGVGVLLAVWFLWAQAEFWMTPPGGWERWFPR